MSFPNDQSRGDLGRKLGLSDYSKQGDSAMAASIVSSTSSGKISQVKDMPSDQPNKIGFLNQCKLELSAEVIRWKEENHKLRKEKEMCEQKICDLQSVLDRLTRRNVELEASLLSSNQDYEKLKMHSLAINEENKYLHRKLSKTCSKYYSYPWTEFGMIPFLNGGVQQLPKAEVTATKGWEEVSEKLIEQMKLEMKELQELGQKLAINELPSNSGKHPSGSLKDNHVFSEQDVDGNGVENSVIDLTCDLESLQQCLRGQHQKLSFLLNQASLQCKNAELPADGVTHHNVNSVSSSRKVDSGCSLIDWETSVSERKFVRPSDDSFRAYFTQQLSNSKSTEELKRMMNFYLDGSKDFSDQNSMESNVPENVKPNAYCPQTQYKDSQKEKLLTPYYYDSSACSADTVPKQVANNSQIGPKNCFSEEERVCPICEAVFPRVFSQKEFESHVVAHLEAESASLLDQYEIL